MLSFATAHGANVVTVTAGFDTEWSDFILGEGSGETARAKYKTETYPINRKFNVSQFRNQFVILNKDEIKATPRVSKGQCQVSKNVLQKLDQLIPCFPSSQYH